MTDERPDALLKSALEKIVYFEARSEQLHNDLEQARAEVARHKDELTHAAQREIELRRQLAEYEVNVARAHAEREEMSRANDALRGERASLIGKLVEASRLHEATRQGDDDGFDLAAFISELRGEVIRSRDVAAAALAAAQPASSVHALRASAAMRAGTASSAGALPVFSNGTLKARAKAAQGVSPGGVSEFTPASVELLAPIDQTTPVASEPKPHAHVEATHPEEPVVAFAETSEEVGTASESMTDATARWAAALTPLQPVVAEVPAASTSSMVSQQAERLKREGRLAVSADELLALSGLPSSSRKAEETLFEYTIRELTASDSATRLRAADRLKVLGNAAAVPAIATALHSETEPVVLLSLLNTFASLAPKEGATAVVPQLDSPHSDVRLTALKALISLDPSMSGPYLSQAMKDPDRAVRRRASLLALGLSGEAALKLGEEAMKDPNGDVRRVAALVLGASGGERARGLLQVALADSDAEVRKASAQALSRVLGKDVSAVVALDDVQRRREIRRISTVPTRAVEAGDVRQALAAALASKRTGTGARQVIEEQPVVAVSAKVPVTQAPATMAYAVVGQRSQANVVGSAGAAPGVMSAPAVATPPPSPVQQVAPVVQPPRPAVDEQLRATIVSEIQCAIRGRTTTELLTLTQVDAPALTQALEQLVSRGEVVRRGMKFFVG